MIVFLTLSSKMSSLLSLVRCFLRFNCLWRNKKGLQFAETVSGHFYSWGGVPWLLPSRSMGYCCWECCWQGHPLRTSVLFLWGPRMGDSSFVKHFFALFVSLVKHCSWSKHLHKEKLKAFICCCWRSAPCLRHSRQQSPALASCALMLRDLGQYSKVMDQEF